MKDLISRESVERMIKNTFADYEWEYDSLLSKLENVPTVEAVPLSVIEDIKAEIECRRNEIKEVDDKCKTISMKGYVLGLDRALEIIDKAVKEIEHE